MNIDPLNNSGIPINGMRHAARRQGDPGVRPGGRRDSLSVDRSVLIGNAMAAIPEVRPEVVERGRQLLADPNYPGPDITRKIAALIVPFDES
ncbi:MAG: hypothetical protein R3F07_15245 [Opitutaceae bacterium]